MYKEHQKRELKVKRKKSDQNTEKWGTRGDLWSNTAPWWSDKRKQQMMILQDDKVNSLKYQRTEPVSHLLD